MSGPAAGLAVAVLATDADVVTDELLRAHSGNRTPT